MIFLHMRGGPAHMDTWEYKPQLNDRGGQNGRNKSRKLVASPWPWKQRGESGLWVSDLVGCNGPTRRRYLRAGRHAYGHLQPHARDVAAAHRQLRLHPAVDGGVDHVWVGDGEPEPSRLFISISPPLINGGAKNYGSAFLPAVYQGTPIGDIKDAGREREDRQFEEPAARRPTTAAATRLRAVRSTAGWPTETRPTRSWKA